MEGEMGKGKEREGGGGREEKEADSSAPTLSGSVKAARVCDSPVRSSG